jgi:hypothetical protein
MVPDNRHHVKDVKLIVGYCYIIMLGKGLEVRQGLALRGLPIVC